MSLSEENKNLKQEVSSLKVSLENANKRCEQYQLAYDQMLHHIKNMQRATFGSKSERYADDDLKQLSLFDDNSVESDNPNKENDSDDEVVIKEHKRKAKSKDKNKDLPVRVEIIAIPDDEKNCGCCNNEKQLIRYESKNLIHYQPEVFEIVEQKREVYACTSGCDKSVVTAPTPAHILPKIGATEEFLSFIIVSKIADRQPIYHLEKKLNDRFSVDISRQSMCNWVNALALKLQPLVNLMKDSIIDYDIAAIDATSLQVLNEPDRNPTTKSYVYCMRGGKPGNESIIYEYNAIDHKEFSKTWFDGFNGYIHCDGDVFFADLFEVEGITASRCNAHSRRYFEKISKNNKKQGIAKKAMSLYRDLYKVEREAKKLNLSPDDRLKLRLKKSTPILAKIKDLLDNSINLVLPKSPLGKAIAYALKLWCGLTEFSNDGRLEIDNNLTEQDIKPFVIARKNFLFANSIAGAKALCLHFSIIRTAMAHNLDPYKYYVAILKKIPYCKNLEDFEKLLPWNIALE